MRGTRFVGVVGRWACTDSGRFVGHHVDFDDPTYGAEYGFLGALNGGVWNQSPDDDEGATHGSPFSTFIASHLTGGFEVSSFGTDIEITNIEARAEWSPSVSAGTVGLSLRLLQQVGFSFSIIWETDPAVNTAGTSVELDVSDLEPIVLDGAEVWRFQLFTTNDNASTDLEFVGSGSRFGFDWFAACP